MDPLVSIIIPVYNGANYMREAIDSAVNQTYPNIEIIVVNDGSSDNGETEAIARSYGDVITYIYKENGGSSSALNCGISHMNGEYFSWLSHDDIYLPRKIEVQVEAIKKKPNSVAICDSSLIDADGNRLLEKKSGIEGEKNAKEGLSLLVHGHGINGCSVLIPKKIIEEIGFFDENMVYLNDLDYWYRMMFLGVEIIYLKDCLVKNRIHGEQVSVRKIELFDKERRYLANKNIRNINNVRIEPQYVLEQLAYFCAYEGLFSELKEIKQLIQEPNYKKFFLHVKYGFLSIYGLFVQQIKKVRRKIVFHR